MSKPSSEQVAASTAEVSHAAAIADAAVPLDALAKEFGEERVTFGPGGEWNVHLEGRDEIERFEAMDEKRSRLEESAGAAAVAARNEVVVRDRKGQHRLMPEKVADSLGLAPKPYWGRPKLRIRVVNGKLVETRFR